jgi:hypothetical protein
MGEEEEGIRTVVPARQTDSGLQVSRVLALSTSQYVCQAESGRLAKEF